MKPALTPREAAEAIRARLIELPAESRPLRQCVGRVLRQVVLAERDNPPFDRVCMDGVAVDSAAFSSGIRRFRMQGIQAAGAVPLTLCSPDSAVEVMTGAVMPLGTDCVIPLEEYDVAGTELALKAEATAGPWRNVQRRGSDSQPGVPMLVEGVALGAAEIAVLASAGLAAAQVSAQPRLMVISTGDELVEPGEPIADHQVRRSNSYGVAAALRSHGYETVHDDHLHDDEALLRARLGEHLARHDVLILSGGVSKGKFDYVPAALKYLGVEEVFYQVAQRPGRPMWFGIGPQGQAVFGLPGNPVSTLICLVRYVLPALAQMMCALPREPELLALAAAVGPRRMTYFMPVKHARAAGLAGLALPCPPNGSGDFLALAGTDGFLELPPRPEGYPEGFVADSYCW